MNYITSYGWEQMVASARIEWDLEQEDLIKIYTHLKKNKTFERVFNPAYNLTQDFYDSTVKYGKARTDHFIYTIKGRTGSGKSTIGAIILYWIHGKDININQVVFNHLEQKKLLKSSHKNISILRDEQTVRVGLGAKSDDLEIQNWDETLRREGINFIYIAPTDRFHGTARKNLEFIAFNKKKRLSLFALYDGLEVSKYYTGYVLFNIPTTKWWKENTNDFWNKYNRKKDAYNKKTRDDEHGIDWNYFIEEVKDHKHWNENINHNELKSIIMELYVFKPKELRDAITTMYMARIGLKKKIVTDRPEKCIHCGSGWLRFNQGLKAWMCTKCSNQADI